MMCKPTAANAPTTPVSITEDNNLRWRPGSVQENEQSSSSPTACPTTKPASAGNNSAARAPARSAESMFTDSKVALTNTPPSTIPTGVAILAGHHNNRNSA